MTPYGLLVGAVTGAGVLLVVLGALGLPPGPRSQRPRRGVRRDERGRRALLAAVAGVGVAALTRWPALGLVAALAVWGIPVLFSSQRQAAAGIDRVEAVEEWLRRLGDVLVAGVGLGQAVVSTAGTAPKEIADEVTTLAARISARWDLSDALRAFADEIADPAGDLAVAALLLAQRRKGPGLAAAISSIADALAQDVAMRRRVEADRAKPRTTARAVTVITLLVVGLGLLTGQYLAPYATPVGQLVLAGVTALFVTALGWMNALAAARPGHRFLAGAPGGRS